MAEMKRRRSDARSRSVANDSGRALAARTDLSNAVNEDDVARRAYELYEARGREHGHDWGDWIQAETELRKSRDATSRES